MHGRVFVQRPVRPNAIIVACIGAQHAPQMPDDVKNLQYRREPAIQLDEEQAIAVGQPNPAPALPPQYDQLLPKLRILRLKPRLRSERRDQHGQNEAEVPDHPISLRDSVRTSME